MTGTGSDELLFRSTETKFVNDWSRDGEYLVYATTNPDTRLDLWLLSTSGTAEPRPLLASAFNEFAGTISPDGRWLAYASDESGEWEVYVQAFPSLGAKQVVSVGGGSEPQWRRDGGELFYLSADRKLMAVTITPTDAGMRVSQPTKLFHVTIPSSDLHRRRNHYAVAADGQRFLVNVIERPRESLTLLVNWTERFSE